MSPPVSAPTEIRPDSTPIADKARHLKHRPARDGDDPADETFPSPTEDDLQLSKDERADEYKAEPLTSADRKTVDQYSEQVISRLRTSRPVQYPDGVISRNKSLRP